MTAPLWTSQELSATLGVDTNGVSATGIAMDSRAVQKGDVFFALRGTEQHGNAFAKQAQAQGAVAVITDENVALDTPVWQVKDSYEALWSLARVARARSQARIVAITGSSGKTSVKQGLAHALRGLANVYMAPASYNNHTGVPLSLANMPANATYGILELGMNHAGEIAELTQLAQPDIAVITNIASAHREFFASVEAIADAKSEIFQGMTADGIAVLPAQGAHNARLTKAAKQAGLREIITPPRDFTAQASGAGSAVSASIAGQKVAFQLPQLGRHSVENSLLVLQCVAVLGEDIARATHNLESWKADKGRGQISHCQHKGGQWWLIDDSYNANPSSMEASIAGLAQCKTDSAIGRTIAVLGDMLELGEIEEEAHRALARPLAAHDIDSVYACGERMQLLWEVLPKAQQGGYSKTAQALFATLKGAIQAGDAVMVKGSRGIALDGLVADLQKMGDANVV